MIVVGTNLPAIIFAAAGFVAVDAGKKWVLERKFCSYCAPSCLPVGRDPAYFALAGRSTSRPQCTIGTKSWEDEKGPVKKERGHFCPRDH